MFLWCECLTPTVVSAAVNIFFGGEGGGGCCFGIPSSWNGISVGMKHFQQEQAHALSPQRACATPSVEKSSLWSFIEKVQASLDGFGGQGEWWGTSCADWCVEA